MYLQLHWAQKCTRYMYVIVYTIKQKVVKTETWDKEFPIVYTTFKIMLHYIIMKHLGAFYL